MIEQVMGTALGYMFECMMRMTIVLGIGDKEWYSSVKGLIIVVLRGCAGRLPSVPLQSCSASHLKNEASIQWPTLARAQAIRLQDPAQSAHAITWAQKRQMADNGQTSRETA